MKFVTNKLSTTKLLCLEWVFFGKTAKRKVINCYMGRIGLINSGGASAGDSDLKEAIITAIINKRAGGMGLITGRKAFQRPFAEGVALLQHVQDVYLEKEITIA